jgi:hypothetical protein
VTITDSNQLANVRALYQMTEVALCESLLAKGLTGGCQYASVWQLKG